VGALAPERIKPQLRIAIAIMTCVAISPVRREGIYLPTLTAWSALRLASNEPELKSTPL
jgi:hypothetical protein